MSTCDPELMRAMMQIEVFIWSNTN
jgi:hypothetical protein